MPQQTIKIVMIGPDDTVLGGMTSVQQTMRKHWNHDDFPMRYLGIYCYGSKFKKFWVAMRSMLTFIWWLIWWRPQIVHVHFSYKAGFYRESLFMLVSRTFGCVTYAHAHAPDFDGFYRKQPSLAQWYIRFVLQRVSTLIALSPVWENYYRTLSPTVPIEVLNNPVEVPNISRPSYVKPIVLTLGELGHRKGTYDLLCAIPKVVEQFPDCEFWLGGDGDVEGVSQLIREQNLSKHVKVLRWIRGEVKNQALLSAMIYALPSYHEGMPVSVIEAMMYGVPVITTRIGSIPYVFEHNHHAILIDAGDVSALEASLLELLANSDKRQTLANNAHIIATQMFAPEIVIDQLETLYINSMRESK